VLRHLLAICPSRPSLVLLLCLVLQRVVLAQDVQRVASCHWRLPVAEDSLLSGPLLRHRNLVQIGLESR
jgi:hypothetical protein